MNIDICINTKKPSPNMKAAMEEYAKRLSAYCKIKLNYLPLQQQKLQEMIRDTLSREHSTAYRITQGTSDFSSEEFAARLDSMGIQGISHISFFIGYPECESSIPSLSLTQITMSDMLTGVVLCEQLYRSYRIIHDQPYHK